MPQSTQAKKMFWAPAAPKVDVHHICLCVVGGVLRDKGWVGRGISRQQHVIPPPPPPTRASLLDPDMDQRTQLCRLLAL